MSPDHDGLSQYLKLADITDPTTHAQAAALLATAVDTGHIFNWGIHVGTGASFHPVSQTLTDLHLYDIELVEDHRRPVLATKVVVFVEGLLRGDTQADIAALRAEHGVES